MIVVLGAGGMLGSTICKLHKKAVKGYTRKELDVCRPTQVVEMLKRDKPEAVINCAGVVPRSPQFSSEYMAFRVNAEVPWSIAELCTRYGTRLIHVSTDCVFKGDHGPYNERSNTDDLELYGLSKARGEFIQHPHLVVRTSFVGLPDPGQRGLLYWLSQQRSRKVGIPAYRAVMWNGVTVDTLADILVRTAPLTKVWGIRHIVGPDVLSKGQLLEIVNKVYEWGLEDYFEPTLKPACNRTLSTEYGDVPVSPVYQDTFVRMVTRMRKRLGDV